MRRRLEISVVLIVLLLVVCSTAVIATSPFMDLPSDHWIYDELLKLVEAGLVREYDEGRALRTRPQLTRYEVALIVGRVHARLEEQSNALAEQDLLKSLSSDWQAKDVNGVFRTLDRALWERIFLYMLTVDERESFPVSTASEVARMRTLAGEAAAALVTLTGELSAEMSALGLPTVALNNVSHATAVPRELGRLGLSKAVTCVPCELLSGAEPVLLSSGLRVDKARLAVPFAW